MTTPRSSARLNLSPLSKAFGLIVLCLTTLAAKMTETAVANGDTRTISLYHAHTHESMTATKPMKRRAATTVGRREVAGRGRGLKTQARA